MLINAPTTAGRHDPPSVTLSRIVIEPVCETSPAIAARLLSATGRRGHRQPSTPYSWPPHSPTPDPQPFGDTQAGRQRYTSEGVTRARCGSLVAKECSRALNPLREKMKR